jgi:CheY-like chemotaxis protein
MLGMGGAGGRGSPLARGAPRRRTSAHSGGGDAAGSHQLGAAVRRGGRGATLKRVLIIEDDADTRACLAMAVALGGYSVSEAEDGRAGLREACANRPDLIVLDLMMPRMDGWQFRAAQKEDPALAGIPVIVTSAVATEWWADLGDVAALFSKPFDIEMLLEAIHHHVVGGCE